MQEKKTMNVVENAVNKGVSQGNEVGQNHHGERGSGWKNQQGGRGVGGRGAFARGRGCRWGANQQYAEKQVAVNNSFQPLGKEVGEASKETAEVGRGSTKSPPGDG
ncbi:hypothetical protein K7X08_016442 [Anisodus acutangulus]|uniref:Uncharacterized protein n=1 Tax=Anisodus acutangulus TaxID=402998 RepID=A0A9Q1LDQ2_9SOLA|nr:hypothetical protein K7X08_016442 [Anisodus acutangulus]